MEQELKELLDRYSQGLCTSAEEQLLQQWFERIGNEQHASGLSASDKFRMLNSLKHSPRFALQTKNRYVPLRYWRWVAAAVFIGVLLITGVWLIKDSGWAVQSPGQVAFIFVETGGGETREVVLPDSSQVWLNARTRLSYHPDFVHHREIRLIGEAFFDVAHDSLHPFTVVTTDSLRTTVMGTRFNIRSYDDFKETQVSVVSGKVRVEKEPNQNIMGVLIPNQSIRFDRRLGSYIRAEVNALSLTAWRQGQWELKDQGIEELKLLLFNQYGVTLQDRRTNVQLLHVDANFSRQQSSKEIVTVFCLLTGCRSEWKSDTTVSLY